MPKRSLKSGNGGQEHVELLNQALDAMLAKNDGRVKKTQREIEPLVRIAADLRNLPSARFKARLKSELGGTQPMSTVAEPVAAVRMTATPRLAFRDPAKAIEFYTNALGAKETFRFDVGGQVAHAEIKIGDSTIKISGEWPEGGRFSAETLGHSPVSLTLEVPDVDAFSQHAVEAGMKLVREAKDQFYGHRDALLEDPFGYSWAVYTITEDMSVEEMHRRMRGLTTGPEGGKMPSAREEKKVSAVPRGFRMVTPYLVAVDGPALIDFVREAFDAEQLLRVDTPTGGVHSELRIGDSMLMLGGGIPGKNFRGSPQAGALHVYVQDADAVCARGVQAGATLVDPVRDQEYGERSGTLKDSAGNFWYVATAKGDSYTPKGLHSVNPYLHPRRAEPLIAFLKRAFQAQEVAKYATPDGVVHHAVVQVGDSVLEMGEAQGKYQTMPAMFYLYVPHVDDVYRQAVAAGATSFQEPADQFYGDRNAAVKDAFGNQWFIATHIKDVKM
jgi:PhnB protein